MKLLILTQKVDKDDSNLGFFHEWICEFSKQVDSLVVICLEKRDFNFPANVTVLSLGKEIKRSRLSYIFGFYAFIWRYRKEYDSVFVHMNQVYVILGGLFWRVSRKKIALWYTHKSVTLSLHIAVLLAHYIFSASKESFRIRTKKLHIMGHGISSSFFISDKNEAKKDTSSLQLITVGRISRSKQILMILNFLNLCKLRNIDVHLNIIGAEIDSDGKKYKLELDHYVNEHELGQFVTFIGAIPHSEVVSYLRESDVFINMSSTGSLDKAILEAMLCGVIPVSCNEAFKDVFGEYAALLYIDYDVEALFNAVVNIKQLDSNKKQNMIRYIQNEIQQKHSLSVLIQKILKIYETSR